MAGGCHRLVSNSEISFWDLEKGGCRWLTQAATNDRQVLCLYRAGSFRGSMGLRLRVGFGCAFDESCSFGVQGWNVGWVAGHLIDDVCPASTEAALGSSFLERMERARAGQCKACQAMSVED